MMAGKSKNVLPRLRILALPPENQSRIDIIREFKKSFGSGIVSASNPRLLAMLAKLVQEGKPEDEVLDWVGIGSCVSQIFSLFGIPSVAQADSKQVEAAIAVISPFLDSNSIFAESSRYHGFQREFASIFDQLKSFDFNEDKLLDLASEAPTFISDKLSALAELGEAVAATLRQIGRGFNADRITDFLNSTEDFNPNDVKADFGNWLIFLSSNESPLHWHFFQKLAEFGANVWIVTTQEVSNYFTLPQDAQIREKVVNLGSPSHLQKSLFTEAKAEKSLDVEVIYAPDALSEAEHACRIISNLLLEGTSPSEIAILIRHHERYSNLLELCAPRFSVDLNISRRISLDAAGLVKFIVLIFASVSSDDLSQFIKVLRSSFSSMEAGMISQFEHKLKSASKLIPLWETIAKINEDEFSNQWIDFIVKWRESSILPASKRIWTERVIELGSEIPWINNVSEVSESRMDANTRVRTAMLRALSEHEIFERGQTHPDLDIAKALEWMVGIWQNSDVSCPSNPEGITVVSSASLLPPCSFCISLGMNEGLFPIRPKENPILSDREVFWLNQHGPKGWQIPDSGQNAKQEREELIWLCGAASKKLFLTVDSGTEERDQLPASYIDEIDRANNGIRQVVLKRSLVGLPENEALTESDLVLKSAIENPVKIDRKIGFELNQSFEKWRWKNSDIVQLGQLSEAIQCPFRRFASRKISVQPIYSVNHAERLWLSLIGLPLQANIFKAKTPEEAFKNLEAVCEQKIQEQLTFLTHWDAEIIRSGAKRLIAGWVNREFASRKMWRQEVQSLMAPAKLSDGLPGIMGDMRCNDTFAAAYKRGKRTVLQKYDWHTPRDFTKIDEKWNEADQAYYGALFGLFFKQPFALEIDNAFKSERTFVMIDRDRDEFSSLGQDVSSGLKKAVVNSNNGLGGESARIVLKSLEPSFRGSINVIKSGSIEATPNDGCKNCLYGELCRRSKLFSELPEQELIAISEGGDPFE